MQAVKVAVPAVGNETDPLATQQSGLCVGARITNLSGTLLRIIVGNRNMWLPALRCDITPMNDETSLRIFADSIELQNVIENQVLVEFAYKNDADNYQAAFPGSYPQDVTRVLGVFSQQVKLTDIAAAVGTHTPILNTLTTDVVPIGTHSLQLLNVPGVADLTNFAVFGHQTGAKYIPSSADIPYANNQPALRQGDVVTFAIDATVDTTYDINCVNAGAGPVTLKVTAILDTQAAYVQNTPSTPLFLTFDQNNTQPMPVVPTMPSGTGSLPLSSLFPGRYDGEGHAHPAAGTKATITLAAVALGRWVCDQFMSAAFNTTNATATHNDSALIDGVSGGANLLHSIPHLYPAVANGMSPVGNNIPSGGRQANAAVNTAMTAEFTQTPPAGAAQQVTIGAYKQ